MSTVEIDNRMVIHCLEIHCEDEVPPAEAEVIGAAIARDLADALCLIQLERARAIARGHARPGRVSVRKIAVRLDRRGFTAANSAHVAQAIAVALRRRLS